MIHRSIKVTKILYNATECYQIYLREVKQVKTSIAVWLSIKEKY